MNFEKWWAANSIYVWWPKGNEAEFAAKTAWHAALAEVEKLCFDADVLPRDGDQISKYIDIHLRSHP